MAQKQLYETFAPKLYAICLRYTSNQSDAKDVLQDAFITILQKIHQYKGDGAFEGWVRRITVNTALARFRDKNNALSKHSDYENTSQNVENDAIGKISADELMAIIHQLPAQYGLVFNMYAIEGYSHKEISNKLDISEGTSKSNLSRARKILQEKINCLHKTPFEFAINERK